MRPRIGDVVTARGYGYPGHGFYIPVGVVVANTGGYYAGNPDVVLVRGAIDTMAPHAYRGRATLERRGVYFCVEDVQIARIAATGIVRCPICGWRGTGGEN